MDFTVAKLSHSGRNQSSSILQSCARAGVAGLFVVSVVLAFANIQLPEGLGIALFVAALLCGYVALVRDQKTLHVRPAKKYRKMFTLLFAGIVCAALAVRLTVLPVGLLHVDAFYHLQAAQQILQGISPDYTRGLLYTVMIAGVQAVFGQTTVVAMLMNVAINMVTLIVLIMLTRKYFSDVIAAVVAVLYAFSPWSISMSSYVRMYDLFQLLMLLTAFLVFHFLFAVSQRQFAKPFSLRREFVLQASMVLLLGAVTLHVHALFVCLLSVVGIIVYLRALWWIGFSIYSKKFLMIFRDQFVVYAILQSIAIAVVFQFFPFIVGMFRSAFTWHIQLGALLQAPLGYYQFILAQFTQPLFFFFMGLGAATALAYKFRASQFIYITAVCFGLCGELLLFERYFSPRYAYHVLPFLYIVIAFGVVSFARAILAHMQKRTALAKHPLTLAGVSAALLLLLLPYASLQTVFARDIVHKNTIDEIFYPYAKVTDAVDINARDFLFSYNAGIWNIMQNASAHITTVYMQDPQGNLKPKKEVAENFLSTLTHAEHGWFLADTYRQKKWDCNLPEMAPCIVRNFVDEAFTLTPEHTVGNLMLYEWTRNFYQLAEPLSLADAADYSSGTKLMHRAWMGELEVKQATASGVLEATHHVRSLKQNTEGAFIVMHPIARLRNKNSITLEKRVIYVPPYSEKAEQFSYTFDYKSEDHAKIFTQDVNSISFTYSVLDIATEELMYAVKPVRAYTRVH